MRATKLPRILLAGASGRLGRLVRAGWRTRPDFHWLGQSRSPLTQGGLIWDPASGPDPLIREASDNGAFAAMVVLAGAVPGSQASESNLIITSRYLDAAARANIRRVLIASSSAVYGAQSAAPFLEESHCRPTSDYGRDKLAMEGMAVQWRDRGIETCSMRIGNVPGADALLGYHRGMEERTIDQYGGGHGPIRSWIDGLTLSEAIADLALGQQPLPQAINVACDPPHAMDELADLAGIPWVGRPATPHSPQSLAMNIQLLRRFSASVPAALSAHTLIERWKSLRDAA